MKNILLLPLFCLSVITPSSAQSGDEKDVAAAVETLRKAMIDADRSVLESLVSEVLSYGHSSGLIEDKATFVNSILSGKDDYKSVELTGQTIRVSGTTAIVRHQMVAEVVISGTPSTANIRVLHVWQKQQGKWKLIARQAFKV